MRHVTRVTLFLTLIMPLATVMAASGLYEAEDTSVFTYAGSGWVNLVDGDYSVMESTGIGDTVAFEFTGSHLIVYRELQPLEFTEDKCVGGTASASSNSSGFPTSQAFDDIISSAWVSNGKSGTQWIEYNFGYALTVYKYVLMSGPSSNNALPTSWMMQYYDGTQWLTAQSVSGISWGLNEEKTFYLTTPYTSPRWRIVPTANGGNVNYAIFEMEIMGGVIAANMEVCIDSVCRLVTNTATTERRIDIPVAFAVEEGTHTVTIENLDGNRFAFNHIIVLSNASSGVVDPALPILSESVAPDPSKHFFTLDSGRVVAIDFVISGGDIVTVIFLSFISIIAVYGFVNARWNSGT